MVISEILMDPLTIRGASSTLTHRAPQQRRSNVRLRVSCSNTSAHKTDKNTSNKLPEKKQLSKTSPQKPMTLSGLKEILEVWRDPEPLAEVEEAKQKITHCFEQRSDSLDLSYLGLSTLPDVFDGMQHIHYLSIANNQFSEIPCFLTKLNSLKLLNISTNILNTVPDFIKEFKYLEWFNAECNQLLKVTEELGRLPKLRTLMLAHNRIMDIPKNIRHIKTLVIEDQIPLASFGDFSPEFSAQWNATFEKESFSGYFEIWLARYEEMLRLPKAKKYQQVFKQRITTILDAMVQDSDFRKFCFEKAGYVVATSHDGILFSLYEMEEKHIEQRMIELKLSDEEVRQEVERAFNFYRLQELALLHAQQISLENDATPDEEIVDGQQAVLFFYISPENTLEMPLCYEIPRLMYHSTASVATDDDVRKAVEQIRREKDELGADYLINFILDKEYWISYLSRRYGDFITEHTQVFLDQLEEVEAKKDQINEYDYLTQVNGLLAEKNESEEKLYYQLTKNIVMDS